MLEKLKPYDFLARFALGAIAKVFGPRFLNDIMQNENVSRRFVTILTGKKSEETRVWL